MKRVILCGVAAICLVAGPAGAQMGGGGIPPLTSTTPEARDTATTGSTTRTGKVKPPGAPVGEDRGTTPELERRAAELDRRIRTGICRGC